MHDALPSASASAMALPPPFERLTPAPRPLRIAMVTSRPPLPMTRADQMTVAHWLSFLAARGHRVELFVLYDAPVAPAAQAWLARHCAAVHWFHRPRWRALLGAFAGVASDPLGSTPRDAGPRLQALTSRWITSHL